MRLDARRQRRVRHPLQSAIGPSRSGEEAPESPPRSGPAGAPTTRAAPATRRRAWPGCGPGAARGTRDGAERRRAAGPPRAGRMIRTAARSSRSTRAADRAHGADVDRLGRPNHWDPRATHGRDDNIRGGGGDRVGRADPHRSSVARIEPEAPPQARGGSTVGLSDWERWLEFCARIDGFPRHLSIHSRRHARHRGSAHRHRAAGAGDDAGSGRRPVRQARRREAEAHQARPARAGHARRDRRDRSS